MMCKDICLDSQAILLLTAPLIIGRQNSQVRPLTHAEYKRLVLRLRELGRKPADLFASDAEAVLQDLRSVTDPERMKQLLERSFQLSQAIERWRARSIHILTRADSDYPQRLLKLMGKERPAVLYCCGDRSLLKEGGLAVVGSRNASNQTLDYAAAVGQLAAEAGRTIISGQAKGIDQAAMYGALEAGGNAVGIVACNLERTIMNRDNRNLIKEGRLVCLSPYDPNIGFNVGHAMQRNKLIYAFSDLALVVNSSYGSGGTWNGALEQLDKFQWVPVYTRSSGEACEGLEGLRNKGARPWPNPQSPEELNSFFANHYLLHGQSIEKQSAEQEEGQITKQTDITPQASLTTHQCQPEPLREETFRPADEIYATAKEVITKLLHQPKKDTEIAEDMDVSLSQVRAWLKRLVNEGVVTRKERPVRYVLNGARQLSLPLVQNRQS